MIIIRTSTPALAIKTSVLVILILGAELMTLAKIKIAEEIISANNGAYS